MTPCSWGILWPPRLLEPTCSLRSSTLIPHRSLSFFPWFWPGNSSLCLNTSAGGELTTTHSCLTVFRNYVSQVHTCFHIEPVHCLLLHLLPDGLCEVVSPQWASLSCVSKEEDVTKEAECMWGSVGSTCEPFICMISWCSHQLWHGDSSCSL